MLMTLYGNGDAARTGLSELARPSFMLKDFFHLLPYTGINQFSTDPNVKEEPLCLPDFK